MAGFARFNSWNVVYTLARSYDTVMTGRASPVDLRMINSDYRRPGNIVMASFTYLGSIDVRGRFTRSTHAIMTGDTGISRCAVIKRGYLPGSNNMTGFTRFQRGHMCCALTCGDHTIMTTLTSPIDLRMVHRRGRRPACG